MRTRIVLALTLAACSSAAPAHDDELDPEPSPQTFDLAGRMARADRVVHGHVSALSYDVATTGPLAGMARTHVIVAPTDASPALDLVFWGGAYPDGRVSIASEIPLFGVGDEVVMLVDRDRASGCPLVDCADGLIRVSAGRAYDAEGHPLVARGNGSLVRGPREAIPEASSFRVGNQTFTVQASDRAPSLEEPIDRAALLARIPTTHTNTPE